MQIWLALAVATALAGSPADDGATPPLIINGTPADLEDYPMAGGLVAEGSAGVISAKITVCSSSLIAPDVVLTAAHCVDLEETVKQQYGITLDDFDIYFSRQPDLSMYEIGKNEPLPEDAVIAADWLMHEDYVGQNGINKTIGEHYDIALIFLDEPLLDAPLAILPTEEQNDDLSINDEVDVVGWGQQVAEDPGPGQSGIKMWGTADVSLMGEPEFKVGQVVTDTRKCFGDSGGPTFWETTRPADDEDEDDIAVVVQVGLSSHSADSTGCKNTGGVDTRVGHHLDWINDQMVAACEDGTRSWCVEEQPELWGILPQSWPFEEDERRFAACGCQTPAPPSPLWLLLAPALLLRRRSDR